MTWRSTLAIGIGAAVLVAALVIVYATPLGSPPPPVSIDPPVIAPIGKPVLVLRSPRGSITLSQSDNGDVVDVAVGDTIRVHLPDGWVPADLTFTATVPGAHPLTAVRSDPAGLWQVSVQVS